MKDNIIRVEPDAPKPEAEYKYPFQFQKLDNLQQRVEIIQQSGMTLQDAVAIAAMGTLTDAKADPDLVAYGAWETVHHYMRYREQYFAGDLQVPDPDPDFSDDDKDLDDEQYQ